jgi:hypothetical protein
MVVYNCNLSAWEAEASLVWGQPGLCSKTQFETNKISAWQILAAQQRIIEWVNEITVIADTLFCM